VEALLPRRQGRRGRALGAKPSAALWSIPEEGDGARRSPAEEEEEEEEEEEGEEGEDLLDELIAAAEQDLDNGRDAGSSSQYRPHLFSGIPGRSLSTSGGRLPSLAGVADALTLRFRDRREEARYQGWHAARMARVDALACLAQAALHGLRSLLQWRCAAAPFPA
jgi:hypothetical protein